MARPWIEYVQSQNLPWVAGDLWGIRPGIEAKILSLDDDGGAASLLIRYPAGWRYDREGALSVDEEFLVLEGEFSIGHQTYRDKSYAHLPAGYGRGPMASAPGAVVLTFISGHPSSTQPAAYDRDRLVENLDAFAVPYTGKFHPEFPPAPGARRCTKIRSHTIRAGFSAPCPCAGRSAQKCIRWSRRCIC